MGRRNGADELPITRWTGPLDFDVPTPSGGSLGSIVLKVDLEDVSIFYGSRRLGLVDRSRLHRWLQRPRHPLQVEEATLTARGRSVFLALDPVAPPVPLPPRVAAQLQAVV